MQSNAQFTQVQCWCPVPCSLARFFSAVIQQIEYSLKRFNVQLFRTRPEPKPCSHLNGAELWPSPLEACAYKCVDCGALLPLRGAQ
jgi:hypothetical protein